MASELIPRVSLAFVLHNATHLVLDVVVDDEIKFLLAEPCCDERLSAIDSRKPPILLREKSYVTLVDSGPN
jgi:hypothetical protein